MLLASNKMLGNMPGISKDAKAYAQHLWKMPRICRLDVIRVAQDLSPGLPFIRRTRGIVLREAPKGSSPLCSLGALLLLLPPLSQRDLDRSIGDTTQGAWL